MEQALPPDVVSLQLGRQVLRILQLQAEVERLNAVNQQLTAELVKRATPQTGNNESIPQESAE